MLEKRAEYGALNLEEDSYSVDNPELLLELASLTHNFLESYLWTLKGSYLVRDRELTQKSLPKKLQEIGQARIATGELRRTEALSVINLSNAVRAFTEENVFSFRANGGSDFTQWFGKSMSLHFRDCSTPYLNQPISVIAERLDWLMLH